MVNQKQAVLLMYAISGCLGLVLLLYLRSMELLEIIIVIGVIVVALIGAKKPAY